MVSIPGVSVRFNEEETDDVFLAVDWRPATHPPMPSVVAHGRPPHVMACGYCHLPDGEGRPENAALAGLPSDYIVQEVRHFATGERSSAAPGWLPGALMSETAHAVSPAELTAAADYFSRLRFTARVRVVEAATVPEPHAINFLFTPEFGRPAAPLGQRIAIAPASMERFERRDSWVDFTAYVPVGALKRGASLAAGEGGVQPCAGCHGEGLKGGAIGPPLAGRSPIYLFRQLYGFQNGARSSTDAAPMKSVTAPLSQPDMIALAAYAASLKP
jgi:cytochrome c553